MDVKARIRGRKAQAQGAGFENLFFAACNFRGIACTRIPDSCKQLSKKIVRIKSPFDWVISHKGRTALIDTKSLDQDTFPHSLIDPHQALTLVKHETQGDMAGYVIWLRKPDEVIYVPAHALCKAMQGPGSIKLEHPEITRLGSIKALDLRQLFDTITP